MKNCCLLFACLIAVSFASTLRAQGDSSDAKPKIEFTGFLDVYYVFDFNRPRTSSRQDFLFNHNRHHEFNMNLGLVGLKVSQENYRAAISLQAGTYGNDNYAAEPGLLKNLFEAHAGISLLKNKKLWLDAGILPSHIGFESAISIDNPTLTRSLPAENSPYFLTGAKISYTSGAISLAAILCNGWQRIQRLEGNSLLSWGTQLTYTFGNQSQLNWSSFVGTDDPDSTRRMRYFNNFFGRFNLSDKFFLTAGFDLGLQQKMKGASSYDQWLSPVLIFQYKFHPQWAAALRGEYYSDEKGVIINLPAPYAFKTKGLSVNLDYFAAGNMACRAEARWMQAGDPVFKENSRNNFILAGSLAVKF